MTVPHALQSDLPPELAEGLRLGSLELRQATTDREIGLAQKLRYQVFYDEGTARAGDGHGEGGRDADAFDAVCDHLLVIDPERAGDAQVVGTYRILRRRVAEEANGFYSADEFDLAPLLSYHGEIMELGRSCVAADYRTRSTMQLLWRGIAAYVFHHDVGLMFGCASMPGTDVEKLAVPLTYLYRHHLAPEALRPRALAHRRTEMNRLPHAELDLRSALEALPPLVKGYLRLGGVVGDGAVIDPQFDTTDVCIIVETEQVTGKYYKHYARTSGASEGKGVASYA